MAFVVDASVAACWLLPDESHARAQAAYARFPDDVALVPPIFWYEMRNLCLVNERRGRIDPTMSARGLALLRRLPIMLMDDGEDNTMQMLAQRHGLSAYDAAYLELAMRLNAPLATLDKALIRAAQAEGVRLVGENDIGS